VKIKYKYKKKYIIHRGKWVTENVVLVIKKPVRSYFELFIVIRKTESPIKIGDKKTPLKNDYLSATETSYYSIHIFFEGTKAYIKRTYKDIPVLSNTDLFMDIKFMTHYLRKTHFKRCQKTELTEDILKYTVNSNRIIMENALAKRCIKELLMYFMFDIPLEKFFRGD